MAETKQNVNSYSPEGRLYQLEYAMKASSLGTTTIGLILNSKVVLLSEKRVINQLQLIHSIKKHFKVFDHVIFGFSGISGDAKNVVDKAREQALYHHRIYRENIPIESLLKHLCGIALKFTESDLSRKIFSRPFGASILSACYDKEPKLFLFDPSGSYRRFNAKVLGSASQVLEAELNEKYLAMTDFDQSLVQVLKMLKEVMRDPITKDNVEVCTVDKEGTKFYTPEEIQELINKF